MQMMIFVLNRIELLEGLLAELGHHGIKGATVFNTTGMAHVLTNDDEMSFWVHCAIFWNRTVRTTAPL